MKTSEGVYFDYHASTPCDPRVVEAMLPFFLERFANPSSSVHCAGLRASRAVEEAREKLAALAGARPGELIFTSGATESNNLAVLGVARAARPKRRKVIVSAIEHKCVLRAAAALEREGLEVVVIPVDREGLIDLAALVDEVDDTTCVVSIQLANNEIGTVQPIEQIAQIVHRVGARLHTDAAQALGRLRIDLDRAGVDLASFSAHKCYGPKGVGALYLRGGAARCDLAALMFGGGQEHDLRPGTLNVPGIVGFGVAADLLLSDGPCDTQRIERLRDSLEQAILASVTRVSRNGCLRSRLGGNSSLTFEGADAEAVIARMPDVALSTGSACASGAPEPSHVLTGIGLSRTAAYQTLRIGLGRFTMSEDVAYLVNRLAAAVTQVREASMSPVGA